jgi:hypothetical protein
LVQKKIEYTSSFKKKYLKKIGVKKSTLENDKVENLK